MIGILYGYISERGLPVAAELEFLLRFSLFPIDERFPDNLPSYFNESIISVSGGSEEAFEGV